MNYSKKPYAGGINEFFERLLPWVYASNQDTNADKTDAKSLLTLQLKNAVCFGKLSFELEEKREQSLITQSGHMLTAFSLYSAALLALLSIIIDEELLSSTQLAISAGIIFIPLIFAFVFTMMAQWRFKYKTLVDAEEFRQKFCDPVETYQEQYQFDYQLITQLQEVQSSKIGINDKRLFRIKAAMICFFVSVAMLFGAYLFFTVLFLIGG